MMTLPSFGTGMEDPFRLILRNGRAHTMLTRIPRWTTVKAPSGFDPEQYEGVSRLRARFRHAQWCDMNRRSVHAVLD
jgi:hypothetical protein